MLRKAVGVDSNGSIVVVIAVFLCFSDQKMFCLLRPFKYGASYTIDIIATVHVPDVRNIATFGLCYFSWIFRGSAD